MRDRRQWRLQHFGDADTLVLLDQKSVEVAMKRKRGSIPPSGAKHFGSIDYVGLGRLVFNQENPVRRRMELLRATRRLFAADSPNTPPATLRIR